MSCSRRWMPIVRLTASSRHDVFNTHYVPSSLASVGCHAFASLPLSEFQSIGLRLIRTKRDWEAVIGCIQHRHPRFPARLHPLANVRRGGYNLTDNIIHLLVRG